MQNFSDVFKRIKQATNRTTQIELAELLEIRQSSISDAKKRNSVPAHWVLTLFRKYGLNPDWVLNGTNPMYLRPATGYGVDAASDAGLLQEEHAAYGKDYSHPTSVKVHASAIVNGEVGLVVVDNLTIPMPLHTRGLLVLRLDDKSMEPTVRKGAFVGIDTMNKRLSSGELFGVVLPHEGHSVRLAIVDNSAEKLLLRSCNTDIPDQTVPLCDHEKFVAGRVHWVIQSYS